MAELTGLVVVHRADQNDLLPDKLCAIYPPVVRLYQTPQVILLLYKGRYILRLQPKYCGVPLSKHFRLVFSQIGLDEILPYQVFLLYNIAVADDEPYRTFQGVQQAVQVGRDMAPGPARAQHDDLDRACLRKFHRTSLQIGIPVQGETPTMRRGGRGCFFTLSCH